MNHSNWIFYAFYQRLRETLGLSLDFSQYLLFVELYLRGAVTISEDRQAKQEIYQVLSTLWLSQPRFEQDFRRLFDEAYEELTDVSQLQTRAFQKLPGHDLSPADPEIFSPGASSDTIVPDTGIKPPSLQPTQYKNIFLQFSETTGMDYSGEQRLYRDTSMDHSFILSGEKFLPMPPRRAQRIWQRFRVYPTQCVLDEIDIEETIQYRARNKVIDRPVFTTIWKNRRQLIALVDNNSGMAPFESWCALFLNTFRSSNKDCSVDTYYFRNAPQKSDWGDSGSTFVFFEDQAFTKQVYLHKLMKNWHRKRTAILIFSNADIGGNGISEGRFLDSLSWLRLLRGHFKHVLWANPYPADRWTSMLAAYGSLIIPMVEMNEEGLREAVRIL